MSNSCCGTAEVLRTGHHNEILLVAQGLPRLKIKTQLNLSVISMLSTVFPKKRRISLFPHEVRPPPLHHHQPYNDHRCQGAGRGMMPALPSPPTPHKHTPQPLLSLLKTVKSQQRPRPSEEAAVPPSAGGRSLGGASRTRPQMAAGRPPAARPQRPGEPPAPSPVPCRAPHQQAPPHRGSWSRHLPAAAARAAEGEAAPAGSGRALSAAPQRTKWRPPALVGGRGKVIVPRGFSVSSRSKLALGEMIAAGQHRGRFC